MFRGGHSSNIKEFISSAGDSEMGVRLHRYLNADSPDQAIEEILEKFAILNILKNDTLDLELL